jgi:general secretion pathway protein A
MYNAFFGLDADPFRINPDPRFLYLSESHREALATLVYAVHERKGFVVLTGEVGTGKTTILNALLHRLDPKVQTAFIFNTALSAEDFFAYLFEELELEPVEPFRKSTVLKRLNEHLIDRLRNGLQTVLIIDEAQNLRDEVLEEIRMLSNLETPQSKLINIMLVGQPELAVKLERPELRQLRQRIELRHTIRPLNAEETAAYIHERLIIAGHDKGDVFSGSALKRVYHYTGGIPRVINVLSDNAMLMAYARQARRVDAAMVKEAALDVGLLKMATPEQAPTAEVAGVDRVVADRGVVDSGPDRGVDRGSDPSRSWLKRLLPRRRAAREMEL